MHEQSLTSLWKRMASRIPSQKEDLGLYFHERAKLWGKLNLSFEEQQEPIVMA